MPLIRSRQYKNLSDFPHLIALSVLQAIKRQRLLESAARRQEEEILRRSAANNVPRCHHYHDHGDDGDDGDDEDDDGNVRGDIATLFTKP